jgi:hypothetical protein
MLMKPTVCRWADAALIHRSANIATADEMLVSLDLVASHGSANSARIKRVSSANVR